MPRDTPANRAAAEVRRRWGPDLLACALHAAAVRGYLP